MFGRQAFSVAGPVGPQLVFFTVLGLIRAPDPTQLNSIQSQSFQICLELCDLQKNSVFLSRKSDRMIRLNSTAS